MKPIRIATTQLERPSPPAPMHCMERYAQAEHAVAALGSAENVVFGGDMCWRDGTDRPFPLPAGWFDAWPAWQALKPPYNGGSWTYDVVWEEDEAGVFNAFAAYYKTMKKRSDRFVCKLKDYSLNGMEIIGDGPSDTVLRCTSLKKKFETIPLRPSCHRGLLMTIAPNEPARSEVPPPAPAPAHGGGAQASGEQWNMDAWEDSD